MGLRDISASLPPGFRFYPSDEELVCHYLYKKITNEEVLKGTLMEIDLHICEPWQLPEVAKLNANEWYFFNFRDRKYATGFRANRATASGYWKATGKDRTVIDSMTREVVGMRKTLVFYKNRAPNGIKTGWIMHEFRLETPHMPPKEDWVLCRVFHKSKEDNTSKFSPQQQLMINMYETTTPSSLPPLALAPSSPLINQTMPSGGGYNRLPSYSFSSTAPTALHHLNNTPSSMINCNLLPFSQETNTANNSTITHELSSKANDDGYGFLWDMDMEENNSLEDGVASNLVDAMGFEVDNNNNVVLI